MNTEKKIRPIWTALAVVFVCTCFWIGLVEMAGWIQANGPTFTVNLNWP